MLPVASSATVPVWEKPQFADAVLGASLSRETPPHGLQPSCTMASLVDSLTLATSLLEALPKASSLPVVRHAASRVHMAFKRSLELCAHPLRESKFTTDMWILSQ